jgi:hypothetical protein
VLALSSSAASASGVISFLKVFMLSPPAHSA